MELECLQFFAGLKSNCLTGRNGYFRAGSRIPPDTGFPWSDVEDAETTQLNAVTVSERSFHSLEYCFNGHLGFSLCYAGTVHDFIDYV